MQGGFRSLLNRHVGGAGKPLPTFGHRSILGFFLGGAAKPPSKGQYAGPRSMLAFWMGGAACPLFRPTPPEPISLEYGLPDRKHPRVIRDDEEVLDFLRLWVTWDNIEGP